MTAVEAIFEALSDLIAKVGGAGAIAAGEPAEEGVETLGEAITLMAI